MTEQLKNAFNFFVSKGYSPSAAAGIVSNLRYESGANLNPIAMNNSGSENPGALNPRGSYGLAQWNGPRQDNLLNYAGSRESAGTLGTQLGFVDHELKNTYRMGPDVLNRLSPRDAASLLVKKYEVPKDTMGAIGVRAPFAEQLAGQFSKDLPMMAQPNMPNPTGMSFEPNQPEANLPAEGSTETKGPIDFMSLLGGPGGQEQSDGGIDLGGRLMTVGAALMARDNPEGAAALSRAIGSPRERKGPQKPHITQSPNGRGFVSIDPTTGQPRYIPMPSEATQEPPDPLKDQQLQNERARGEFISAQTEAQKALANSRETKGTGAAVAKPKPQEITQAVTLTNEAQEAQSIVEDANKLRLAIAEGKVTPNFLKGKGWELQAATGIAPEEALQYNQAMSTLNKGILEASKGLKGSISDKDLQFLTSTVIHGGATYDAGSLYNSLANVSRSAMGKYKTNAGAIGGILGRYPGILGGTPEDNQAAIKNYKDYSDGWQKFHETTLEPKAKEFFNTRFGKTQEAPQQSQDTPSVGITREAYDQLKPGDTYIGPDGKKRRKN